MIFQDKVFIGKTIQMLRKNKHIKQSELSEKIGISEKHLSKIETGRNLPSLDNFLKMAQILNFGLDDFGIKVTANEGKYKQELLKIAYSVSEEDAKSYCKLINTIESIIKK